MTERLLREPIAYWLEGEAFRYGADSEIRQVLREAARAIRAGEMLQG